jgi:hypothetical protein
MCYFLLPQDVGLSVYETGLACPSTNPVLPCSDNGVCDCATGQCACSTVDACTDPASCFVTTCSNHGICMPDQEGACSCDNCWEGESCDTRKDCGESCCPYIIQTHFLKL